VGYFFLAAPPEVSLPLPDFRTRRDGAVRQPSPDLLDTIFLCEQRQEWYRDYARINYGGPLEFVGSLTTADDITTDAAAIRGALSFEEGERGASWTDSFRRLTDQAEDLGILVMVSGVVGSNTHRRLDPDEFLGFALADEYAPAIFINGASTRAAQVFTLTHELVHIWLGQSALDDPDMGGTSTRVNDTERWCNQVAAEILVPLDALAQRYRPAAELAPELDRLARAFKVSTLVILRRIRDAGHLDARQYWAAYHAEFDRVRTLTGEAASGGNFYNTQPVRASKRFARAIITSTLEGQTLYGDAFQLLGFRKVSTFNELAQRLGVT
jgi:Zn-dependent peptidase ImmA (M78 family)